MAAYAVAKSAVHALTRVLALENRDRGVRFNSVLPGIIDTPANRSAMSDAEAANWTTPEAIARVMACLIFQHMSNILAEICMIMSIRLRL